MDIYEMFKDKASKKFKLVIKDRNAKCPFSMDPVWEAAWMGKVCEFNKLDTGEYVNCIRGDEINECSFAVDRLTSGQVELVWADGSKMSHADGPAVEFPVSSTKPIGVYCTCGGLGKQNDTGMAFSAIYFVCTKCKKEKR
jgi:hypothetical protein